MVNAVYVVVQVLEANQSDCTEVSLGVGGPEPSGNLFFRDVTDTATLMLDLGSLCSRQRSRCNSDVQEAAVDVRVCVCVCVCVFMCVYVCVSVCLPLSVH